MYYPPEERDFFTYLDDLKYERAMRDPDHFIKNARIINFDIIHECREQPLENSYKCYQTLKENEPSKYQAQPKKGLLEAIQSKEFILKRML